MNTTNIEQLKGLGTAAPVVAFASGKGGAGKTGVCLNIAYSLAKQGKKVLVFDGDLGLGNVDVQLGLAPQKDLSHVIAGTATLQETVLPSGHGFNIIPGRSGSARLPFLDALERRDVLKQLRVLSSAYDSVFLDVAAGVSDEVLGLLDFADKTVLVVTPDPSSITDAYAVLKLLKNRYDKTSCEILVNQYSGEIEGKKTYEKLHTAAEKFLKIDLPFMGMVPYERPYASAVKMQKLAMEAFPNCKACARLEEVARTIIYDAHKTAAA